VVVKARGGKRGAAAGDTLGVLVGRMGVGLEMGHLALCCRDGKLLEPPLPRMRNESKSEP
jgi:hypothetical protein